jgi:glycerophosphoryl diester phosphodiesterase
MVFVVAHRGASAYELENTMDAFKKALEMGCEYIECDVRVSKDGQLVVIHDSSLRRVFGVDFYVNELTAEELKKYRIPLLEEVLDLIKIANKEIKIKQKIEHQITKIKAKKKKIWLLIEIKEPGCEEKLVRLIKKKGMVRSVIVVSFFDDSLKKIKELINVKTGFIFSLLDHDVAISKALSIKADFIIPRYDVITKGLIRYAHKNKMKVIAWTVNETKIAKQLIKLRVDGIASDKPDILNF